MFFSGKWCKYCEINKTCRHAKTSNACDEREFLEMEKKERGEN
jgi:hypothetical protein